MPCLGQSCAYVCLSMHACVCVMHEMLPYACREAWKALAAGRGPPDARGAAEGQHVHLQFCNMTINDSTYLLGEALEKLPQVLHPALPMLASETPHISGKCTRHICKAAKTRSCNSLRSAVIQ